MKETLQKKYLKFKSEERQNWLDKMVWCKNGKYPFNTGAYDKFIKKRKPFENLNINNVVDYFKFIDNLSNEYVSWAKSVDSNYTDDDYVDMKDSFKGFFGEWFSYRVAEDTTRLIAKNNLYTIRYMSPNLINEDDNGIDFTAIINDEPSVIQVKWWNKWSTKDSKNTYLSEKVFQSLGYEGATAGYISLTDEAKENMFFIWLASEEEAYKVINKNPRLKGRVVVFGEDTWNFSINGKDTYFWENIWNELLKIIE